MGQVINVEARSTPDRDVHSFVMDRSLTGMGLKEYLVPEDVTGDRPEDLLARLLFKVPAVATVFVYGNVVTVSCVTGSDWSKLDGPITDIIRNLFVSYDVNRL